MFLFSSEQIIAMIAEAYGDAARSNADMRAATDALEKVRATLLGEKDFFAVWSVLDEQVGQAEAERLQPSLLKLRERFEQTVTANEIARLDEAFRQDAVAGWDEWIKTYARAFCEWRVQFCHALSKASLPAPTLPDTSLEKIRHYTRCMLHQRWAETIPWVLLLAQQEIKPQLQAKLLVIAGEIQIYHLLKPDNAKKFFEQAEQIAPDEVRVQSGWSEYWRQQPDLDGALDKAKVFAKRVIEIAPQKDEGYIGLGECYEKAGDLDAAEKHYQQAIVNASGSAGGYTQLIRLYGRRERFSSHKDRLPGLVKRLLALDPSAQYGLYLEEGYIYQQNKLYDDAHQYYEKAISLDETRLGGYTSNGYAYLDEANEKQGDEENDKSCLEKCRYYFQRAVAVAPESFDGYSGMALLCEHQERWEEALSWCERSLPLRPEWESLIRIRMADLKRRLGQFKEAEAELERALHLEAKNQQAFDTLVTLAADYYKTVGDTESALRIYDDIRQRQGQEFEDSYHNLIGNLKYYHGDYEAAVEAYRRASAIKQTDAVYFSNLALALQALANSDNRTTELEEAAAALRRARELAPDEKDYAERLDDVERQLSFVARYGEDSLKYKLMPQPIRVSVQVGWLPYVLTEGLQTLSEKYLRTVKEMRARILEDHGITVPSVQLNDLQESNLLPGTYRFSLMEEKKAEGVVALDKKFTPGPQQEKLAALGIEGEPAQSGIEGYWIAEKDWPTAIENGLELLEPDDFLLRHLEVVLRQNLEMFLHFQETMNLLAACETDACVEIIKSTPKVLMLTMALKSLLAAQQSIADFKKISENLLALYKETVNLLEVCATDASTEIMKSMPKLIPFTLFWKASLEKQQPSTDFKNICEDFLALYKEKVEAKIFGDREMDTTGAGKSSVETASLKLSPTSRRP
jgi:tetratricopeptide (TPR) repeat protein